jgi:hypothetical protein
MKTSQKPQAALREGGKLAPEQAVDQNDNDAHGRDA